MNEQKKYSEILTNLFDLVSLDAKSNTSPMDNWRLDEPNSETVKDILFDQDKLNQELEKRKKISSTNEYYTQKMYSELLQKKRRRISLRVALSIAAAVVCVSFLIGYELVNKEQPTEMIVKNKTDIKIEVPTLVLETGEIIEIRKAEAVKEARVHVSDLAELKEEETGEVVNKTNKIRIPDMKILTLILEDGSEIILDAKSELEYPSSFNKNERKVKLTGNAYFKVAKSDTPFIVDTEYGDIKVYGTEFNVNTNKDLSAVLVSGSVGVTPENSDKEIMILPSEKITVDSNGSSLVTNEDVRRYIAWSEGYFRAYEDELGDLVDNICEWYGITITNQTEELRNKLVTASVKRDAPLSEAITVIEMATNKILINEGKGVYIIE